MKEYNQFKAIQFPSKASDLALLSYEISLQEIEALFGIAHQESANAWEVPGPTLYWGFEYVCGLQIVLEFHLSKDFVNICADLPEMDHILSHLALPQKNIWRRSSDDAQLTQIHTMHNLEWALWRQDDNGHKEIIKNYEWEREAYCQLKEFEKLHHKQTYWIEKQTIR